MAINIDLPTYWNWDIVEAICNKTGVGTLGEFDRQAIRALVAEYESMKAELANLKLTLRGQ